MNIVYYIRGNQMATEIFLDLLSVDDLAGHIGSIENGKMTIQSKL